MKNKFIKYSFNLGLTALAIVVTANISICTEAVQQAAVPDNSVIFHSAVIKFLKAMGGVALSSFIIYAGLTVYNKFFVAPRLDGNSEDDVLKTPHSTDEALTFFIKKNKIK